MTVDLKTPPITPTNWSITRYDWAPKDLVICCVCYGTKYSNDYVRRLQKAVEKNIDASQISYKFVCLSDRKIPEVYTLPLPKIDSRAQGWWQKVGLFRPARFLHGTRILYLDLDVVITGDLTVLIKQWAAEPLTMIYNFGPNRSHCAHNSSVMLWTAGDERLLNIWIEYKKNSAEIMRTLHGDQCYFWRVLREDIANFPRDYIASYKYDVRGKQRPDPLTRVVVFHGDPKPEQCREPWILEHWRNTL